MGIPNHYLLVSSPRPWGCFLAQCLDASPVIVFPTPVGVFLIPPLVLPVLTVFPTPVGVFPTRPSTQWQSACLPHARGGVSEDHIRTFAQELSSPRPWGCFRCWMRFADPLVVFPTPVGVFLHRPSASMPSFCLPHARGGVSDFPSAMCVHIWSSPRPWGCFFGRRPWPHRSFVFPTPVGVFPTLQPWMLRFLGLPHARGGVSGLVKIEVGDVWSSPRPWGCFRRPGLGLPWPAVFPTPVGVFLAVWDVLVVAQGLPHARGGVSCHGHLCSGFAKSSPRPWGCFFWQRRWHQGV